MDDFAGLVVFGWSVVFIIAIVKRRSNEHKRNLRKLNGLCLTCGYDLTGNVSGTCPECGEEVG
ncbi:MAG: hypothetical protein JWP03_1524 [Phycisphaerales bacterium]|nr:hypothetical protein [Phycisphaerales bacterium]